LPSNEAMKALANFTEDHRLEEMRSSDLPEVCMIEQAVYALPWTTGNFIDSLGAGHAAMVLRAAPAGAKGHGQLLGYFLAMQGAGEMHLLNIAVAPAWQGRNLAQRMLDELCRQGRQAHCEQIWLEVRQGNAHARRVYRRYGFAEVGVRPAYYPVLQGPREDAVLMSLALQGASA
jgi:ribosomal-protein-alanine N-acetyltransferase